MQALHFLVRGTLVMAVLATAAACGDADASMNLDGNQVGGREEAALSASPVVSGFIIHTRQEATVGRLHKVRVDATDSNGSLDANYVGIASVTSSDGAAVVPPALAFSAYDKGEVSFFVTFSKLGSHEITVTDMSGRRAQRQVDVQAAQSNCAAVLQIGAACNDDNAACCATGLICADRLCVPGVDPSDA